MVKGVAAQEANLREEPDLHGQVTVVYPYAFVSKKRAGAPVAATLAATQARPYRALTDRPLFPSGRRGG